MVDKIVTNEEIAELLAKLCYKPNSNRTDVATQLFIERVVLPKDVSNYTEFEMKSYILRKLDIVEKIIKNRYTQEFVIKVQ